MIIVKTTFNVSAEAKIEKEEDSAKLIEEYRKGSISLQEDAKNFSDGIYTVKDVSLKMTISKDDGVTWEEIN